MSIRVDHPIRNLIGRFQDVLANNPWILVDIGAAGHFPLEWVPLSQAAKIIGFEPEEQAYQALISANKDSNLIYLNTALWRGGGEVKFRLTRFPTWSSVLIPNRNLLERFSWAHELDIVAEIDIPVDTLDNQLEGVGIEDVDFIKLDTQGSELFILQGGTRALCKAFGLRIEVEFLPIYENQPLFPEVDLFVRSFGFEPFDLLPCYCKRAYGGLSGGRKGQLAWADVLYFKDFVTFQQTLRSQPGGLRKTKLLKALLLLIDYGYMDYALWITHRPEFTECFSPDEARFIATGMQLGRLSTLIQAMLNRIRRVHGAGRLARVLHSASVWLTPSYEGEGVFKEMWLKRLGNL